MAKKTGGKIFLWIIMGLLFIGLMGFGATGLTGTVSKLGTVGEKDISINRYARELNSQLRAFEAQSGSPISFTQAQQIGLDRLVLDQLIIERVLDAETARLGISAGDENVRDQLLAINGFQDLSGNFSRETYRDALSRMGETEETFETSLRDEISRTILQAALLSGIAPSETYKNVMIDFAGERRAVTWAEVTSDLLTAPLPAPTSEELQSYYAENPDEFTALEERKVTYAILTPEMYQSTLEIDPESIATLYRERISEFNQPEKRLVERLVFFDEDAANSAFERIDSGQASFEEIVAERGLSLSDIDLGDVAIEDLGASGEAVFATPPQSVTAPLTTELGVAIFRVNAIIEAQSQSLEDVSSMLRDEIASSRARRLIDTERENVLDLLAGGATVEDLVDRTPMQIGQLDWNEETKDGPANYESFRIAVGSVEPGDYPELGDLSDGGIFALRVDEIIPPTLQPFSMVEDEVRAGWLETARAAAVERLATDLSDKILPLTSFESLGLVPNQETDLTRRGFVAGTPPEFVTEVFAAEIGDVSVIDNGATQIVARVDAIRAPDTTDPDVVSLSTALGERHANSIAQDLFERVVAALRRETEIRIDDAAVRAVHANFQ